MFSSYETIFPRGPENENPHYRCGCAVGPECGGWPSARAPAVRLSQAYGQHTGENSQSYELNSVAETNSAFTNEENMLRTMEIRHSGALTFIRTRTRTRETIYLSIPLTERAYPETFYDSEISSVEHCKIMGRMLYRLGSEFGTQTQRRRAERCSCANCRICRANKYSIDSSECFIQGECFFMQFFFVECEGTEDNRLRILIQKCLACASDSKVVHVGIYSESLEEAEEETVLLLQHHDIIGFVPNGLMVTEKIDGAADDLENNERVVEFRSPTGMEATLELSNGKTIFGMAVVVPKSIVPESP